MPANLEYSAVAIGLEKISFHSNPKEKQCQECSNNCTIALISHTSKVICKTLQARLQQYMNQELPDIQAGFRKGRGTTGQIASIQWIIEKAREFQNSTSASLAKPKPLPVSITINCGKFLKEAINKVQRQPSEWWKITANETTDKGFISKIYRQPI